MRVRGKTTETKRIEQGGSANAPCTLPKCTWRPQESRGTDLALATQGLGRWWRGTSGVGRRSCSVFRTHSGSSRPAEARLPGSTDRTRPSRTEISNRSAPSGLARRNSSVSSSIQVGEIRAFRTCSASVRPVTANTLVDQHRIERRPQSGPRRFMGGFPEGVVVPGWTVGQPCLGTIFDVVMRGITHRRRPARSRTEHRRNGHVHGSDRP